MRNHFFLSDVHLATSTDELRPAMNYVFFKDGFVIATDAHILVKQDLTIHEFSPEDIEILNGKMLHRAALVAMKRYKFFEVKPEGVECLGKACERVLFKFNTEDEVGKYPNFEPVIGFVPGSLDRIGINADYLLKLKKCLVFDGDGQLTLCFQKRNTQAIFVRAGGFDESKQLALMMPYQLKDDAK